MVVDIVHEFHVASGKPECDAPIAADPYRPVALQGTFEGVQTVPWMAQVRRGNGGVERGQYARELCGMSRLDAAS